MKHPCFKTILLCFCLLASINAFAEAIEINGIYYNLDFNQKTAEVTKNPFEYKDKVKIPETVAFKNTNYSVTSIGDKAFYDCYRLTSITIPNSVTSIGNQAFYECSGLKKVIIPDIAAWCTIVFGGYVYNSNPLYYAKHIYRDESTEITNLVIPNSVTSIESGAFSGCIGLTSVTIPNSVTSIGLQAFHNCSSLTSVTIPNSVTSIGWYAFRGCSSLTSITISNSVTSIGVAAFQGCERLKKVIVPDIATWCAINFLNEHISIFEPY